MIVKIVSIDVIELNIVFVDYLFFLQYSHYLLYSVQMIKFMIIVLSFVNNCFEWMPVKDFLYAIYESYDRDYTSILHTLLRQRDEFAMKI
jgi:hypothetical protein